MIQDAFSRSRNAIAFTLTQLRAPEASINITDSLDVDALDENGRVAALGLLPRRGRRGGETWRAVLVRDGVGVPRAAAPIGCKRALQ